MSGSCNQECGSCSVEGCSEKKPKRGDFFESTNVYSEVKKVIGVVSGKGGVGKSSVTSMLAVAMNRRGYSTAIMDADITGPSIPKAFGLKGKAQGNEFGLSPVRTKTGINVMSINLLLENHTDPVVWRGPIIGGTVKQFWTDVVWGSVDYMFVDMPPGTGDVPLTVFQSIPLDGIIIVTTPQDMVSMIVAKAVNMAKMMDVPILGLVENMSYFTCDSCDKEHYIFGESTVEAVAKEHGIAATAKLPIDKHVAAACDNGMIELIERTWLDAMLDGIDVQK